MRLYVALFTAPFFAIPALAELNGVRCAVQMLLKLQESDGLLNQQHPFGCGPACISNLSEIALRSLNRLSKRTVTERYSDLASWYRKLLGQ